MRQETGDPIGAAIQEYARTKKPKDIIVSSDICDDDIIPVEVLFRKVEEMPKIEQLALDRCSGKVLDVGAGAGVHALELMDNGMDVTAIDISQGAVDWMIKQGIHAQKVNFFELKNEQYDTILMLMNGIGIAGTLANLERTLTHAANLLKPGGKILCDSSDIKYLYEDEDGSLWVDLNTEYYGNFKFQMHYKKTTGDWFEWLYVDYDSMHEIATKLGFKCKRIMEQDNHYLAQLSL